MPRVKKRDNEDFGDTSSAKRRSKNGSRGRKSATYMEEEVPDALIEKIKLKSSPHAGELLFAGGTHWDMIGKSRPPKNSANSPKPMQGGRNLYGPHRLGALNGIRVRGVFSGPNSCHSIIVSEEGKAYSWGRNANEQLGHGDSLRRDVPTLIEGLKEHIIVNAACGRNHTLCLTETGTVYSFGDNKFGQLGLGHQTASISSPCKLQYKGQPIVKVACGGDFSIILDCKGNLHSFGCPEYSQLGHNSTGQYFVTSSKLSFDCITTPRKIPLYIEKTGRDTAAVPNVVIKDVACGTNHAVAMDMQKRVFTWGFGGYGRLGHNEPKDEPVPRSIKIFDIPNRGAAKIWAGATYSMAHNECGSLLLWGQTKRTGEASMYPKPVTDLAGWNVRSVGCSNTSIVLAADESVIAWGPSPTYGELCFGENSSKSSTVPKESKPLDGVYIHSVSCGMGHVIMIARDDSDEEKKKIMSFPAFGPLREIPEEEKLAKQAKLEAAKEEDDEDSMEVEDEVEDMTPVSAAAAAAAAAAERAAAAAPPSEEEEEEESPTRVPFTVAEGESDNAKSTEESKPVQESTSTPSTEESKPVQQSTSAPSEEETKPASAPSTEEVAPVNGSSKVEETSAVPDEQAKEEEAKPSEDNAAEDDKQDEETS